MPIETISKAAEGAIKRPSKLNVLIADASGSMYWAMNQLAKDTEGRIDNLPQGDAVLIGLFSTKGWFEWIAARELSSSNDFDYVKKLVREKFYTRGMTCFSDIMADVPQAIKPFAAKYPVVSLTFMSDGHPVVPNVQQEEQALMKAAEQIRDFLT